MKIAIDCIYYGIWGCKKSDIFAIEFELSFSSRNPYNFNIFIRQQIKMCVAPLENILS